MKKIYAPILLVLSIAFFPSPTFGQILTPHHEIQGDSENNNVNIGPNPMPDARLRIEPSTGFGTLLLQTITGQVFNPGGGGSSTSSSPYALRIEHSDHLHSPPDMSTVFNIRHTGQTTIGNISNFNPILYTLSVRNQAGVFTDVNSTGFGSITQGVSSSSEQRIGWTARNNHENPKLHIGYGLTSTSGFNQYEYTYIPQLTLLKKDNDFSHIGINQSEPSAPLHIRYTPEGINESPSGNDHGLLIENSGWKSHDYALRVKSHHGDIFRLSNAGELKLGKDMNTSLPGDYRLYVADGIRTEKIRVDIASANGWADYVFEEDYVLIPIDELEAFIKENKHLPGVPSAADVVEEGVDLGEMNAILLRHIEELTLRIIKMEKGLTELEKNK